MPEFQGVSHVDLTVRDADRSGAWYERVLCLNLLGQLQDLATPWLDAYVVTMMHPATGLTINLVQHNAGVDDEFSEFRIGLDHLSLAVESREELERWLEHLDACGVPHSGASEMPYGWVVVFRDPDNIQLELLAAGPDFRLA